MKTKQELKAAALARGIKATIVAEFEVDESNIMTDYFGTSTDRRVILGFSQHTRDSFAEMRKAATRLPETEHLGPGCDLFTARVMLVNDLSSAVGYHLAGSYSPWHTELRRTFSTREAAAKYIDEQGSIPDLGVGPETASFRWDIEQQSIEHREKYSLGAGYYLKGSSRYSSGWKVRKTAFSENEVWKVIEAGGLVREALEELLGVRLKETVEKKPSEGLVVEVRRNEERQGVEIIFGGKPSAEILSRLKREGFRWSRSQGIWYAKFTEAKLFTANSIASEYAAQSAVAKFAGRGGAA